ncbi:MAG: hypothetical protein MUF72_16660 [Elainella sp. Prado103]|nr:hypothetical protein [Elainella sp. Prado103]
MATNCCPCTFGDLGNDTYSFDADTALGDNRIVDRFGINTIDLSSTSTKPISLNLTITDTQSVAPTLWLTLDDSVIHQVTGGNLDDTIRGNSLDNTLGSGNIGNGFSNPTDFATVSSDGTAATSSALIVYNSVNGRLFYNQNGANPGFSSIGTAEGLFATLD